MADFSSVIDSAEQKRTELLDTQAVAKRSAKIVSMLPKAAKEYRSQIADGLDNDSRAAGKARIILRKLLGNIRLTAEQGSLWAEYRIRPPTLLKGVGTDGSGGVICVVPTVPQRGRLK